jgi:hypothetical protein
VSNFCDANLTACIFECSYPATGNQLKLDVLVTTGTIDCTPCSSGLYSLDRGVKHGNGTARPIKCSPCPYGASCVEGGAMLKVKSGFWGQSNVRQGQDDVLQSGWVAIVPCPLGYCCANSSGCDWNSTTACQGNRDRSYPLCGGCIPDYSQAVDGISCVAVSNCGHFTSYLSTQLLYWLGYCVYMLYEARYPPLLFRIPRFLRPSNQNDGGVSVVVFFFQLAMTIVPSGYDAVAERAAIALGQASRLEQLGDGGTCIAEGMTMLHRLVWRLLQPLVVLSLLLLLIAARHLGMCLHRLVSNGFSSPLRVVLEQPLVDVLPQGADEERDKLPVDYRYAANSSVIGAVACLLLFTFTSFSEATLRLLNCIHIDGHANDVLFYAGGTNCDSTGWQLPLYFLLIVLIVMPLLPVGTWVLCNLPSSWALSSWARQLEFSTSHSLLHAVGVRAVEPFVDHHWHWTAVLALQRLLTVMCQSLVQEGVVASVGVTCVSFCFALLQVIVARICSRGNISACFIWRWYQKKWLFLL